MTDSATIKGFVERIERLDTEQQTVGLDKKSVYDEAKKAGVNTKMLRRFIAERKRDAKDSQTDKDALDAYRAALGEPGATYRSVAAKLGMPKSTLHRLVPKRGNGTAPTGHDAKGNPLQGDEDGVVIETNSRAAGGDEGPTHGEEGSQTPVDPPSSGLEPNAGAAGGAEAPAPSWTCPMRGQVLSCAGHTMRTDPPLDPPLVACVNTSCPHAIVAQSTPDALAPEVPRPAIPGGDHVTAPADINPNDCLTIESPAGGEKPVPLAGASDDSLAVAEPEVAVVAPPATDPAEQPKTLYQRITGAFVDPREDDLAYPDFLDRRKSKVPA